jgi:PEGA domain-containing protein
VSRCIAWILCLLVTLATARARADDARERARALFSQGVDLFDRGDYRGAVDAFEDAYAATPYPVILYNIGLAEEKLDDPLAAIAAMKRALEAPDKLAPERAERARRVIDEQTKRLAVLAIRCNVDGAVVEVGGRTVGTTPLTASIAVKGGDVQVHAQKDGYAPASVALRLKNGEVRQIDLELVAAAAPLAQVKVHSRLPAAEVWIDGTLWGTTPLASTIPLESNRAHRIEVRREGYLPAGETLTPLPSTHSELTLEPSEDRDTVRRGAARLVVEVTPADSTVLVDGEQRDVPPSGIAVAVGVHVIEAERTGYVPLRQLAVAEPSASVTVRLDLPPTPQTRADLVRGAERTTAAGWGLVGGGAALAIAGAAMVGWAVPARADAVARIEQAEQVLPCGVMKTDEAACAAALAPHIDDRNVATGVTIGGSIAAGLGAIGLVTGIILLATGDDPSSFEIELSDELGRVTISPGGASIAGRF